MRFFYGRAWILLYNKDLFAEICRIPLIDPHSHINPHRAAARSLDDILGYHYYTELAHSAGMDQAALAPNAPPRERDRATEVLQHLPGVVDVQLFGERAHARFAPDSPFADPDRLAAALTQAGVVSESVRHVPTSLEDVFIARVTGH